MPFGVTPTIGVNTDDTYAATLVPPFNVGLQVFGNDGRRYVFGRASGAIAANTATCTVNATTFAATGTGGTYRSPAVALATNEYGWFGAASV